MNFNVKMLEKLGQTQSIHQVDSVNQMAQSMGINEHVFKKLKDQSQDLVCLILPDDDDEE